MDQARLAETVLRVEHLHRDGTWGEMVEDRSHHAPADHDPERLWTNRRIFRCTSCSETLTVVPGEEGGPPPER